MFSVLTYVQVKGMSKNLFFSFLTKTFSFINISSSSYVQVKCMSTNLFFSALTKNFTFID
jgi:hypothetical protein